MTSVNRIFSLIPLPTDVAYSLTFKTGDMPYAGTDANVTLQLFGDKGQTEKIMLRQESGKTLKRFDRGRTDRFTVQTMDVGKVSLYSIPIRDGPYFLRGGGEGGWAGQFPKTNSCTEKMAEINYSVHVYFLFLKISRLRGFASATITQVQTRSGI